jgi:erythronate-4-phosphate dehydrogenase
MRRPVKIVADNNIPGLERWTNDAIELLLVDGRDIRNEDVLDADALLVRSITQVNDALLHGSRVSFVGTATSGTDHIDAPWLESRGIQLAHAAGANANAVAEYVIATLATLIWEKGFDPWQSTVAVIGVGHVGSVLVRRLQFMGIACVGHDPLRQTLDDLDYVSFEQALKADVICVHTPLTFAGMYPTHHMIAETHFEMMQRSAVLINAGRGEVIDTPALLAHLDRNPGFTAVLDVWEHEPHPSSALLRAVDILTPHIAGYSAQAKLAATQRITTALCARFGLDVPVLQKTSALITPDFGVGAQFHHGDTLNLQQRRGAQMLFAQHVLKVFAPGKLSQQYKTAAVSSVEAYDTMRVDLSHRREFSCFSFNALQTGTQLASWLHGAGFVVQT